MRVVHIHRPPRPGAHSIEELFRALASELRNQVEVIEYRCGPRSAAWRDARKLRRLDADVYHVTGDVHYIVPALPRERTVLTVHDLNHLRFGLRGLRQLAFRWLWYTLPLHAARAVTVISEATRQDIVDHLGFAAHRMQVIENCYSPVFRPLPRAFDPACPVILQIGTKSNKNVERLVAALQGIACKLLIVGPVDAALARLLVEHGVTWESRVDLTHAQIAQAYAEADVVTFVSLREGFGMPIIEAQACARPVVTSDISPMREVAGAGACLVSPHDTAAIRAGIVRVIADAAYRSALVDAGLRNVARYAPSTISARYLALYRRVCGHSRVQAAT